MEDLSSFNIQLNQKMNSIEDLYSSMEGDSDLNNGRPASTMSFSSWTFSPISEDNNRDVEEDQDLTDTSSATANQLSSSMIAQPMGNSVTNQQYPMIQYHHPQINQEQNNSGCEYVYPNAIAYHHSVNIHNYVGSYCMGPVPPVWKQEPPSNSYPGFTERQHDVHPQQQMLQVADHNDLLSTINTAGLEFTRCSTPEYLMALNSLNQLDSPPKPSHSAATNIDYSRASFNESMHNRSMDILKQDSGYNSDLSESPIIQFQDGTSKTQQHRLTSTPQPMPVLKLANLSSLAKGNLLRRPVHSQQFAPARFNSEELVNKPVCANKPRVQIQQNGNKISVSKDIIFQVPSIKTTASSAPKFANMAEYQTSQKAKAAAMKCKSVVATETSKRRHNAPLSKNAHDVMNKWYVDHSENPYPNKVQKEELAKEGGITVAQVKSWFANKRNRNHNTRPKKHLIEMEGRLMDICHQLARDATKPYTDNAYYIQQLSSMLHHNTK